MVVLSERQLEILTGLSFGMTYKEIAHEMGIAFETVKWHAKSIYRTLGVSSKTEAVTLGFHMGVLSREFNDE